MGKLNGTVAVVTGASKGIGAGIAKSLAEAGAAVVVNYATSREGAERVVAEIEAKGGRAAAVQGDMSKSADVLRLFAEAKKRYGSLDVLVNNAGVYHFDALDDVTEAEFHRHFNTNVLGPILAIQEAVKHFGPTGGSIINIGSVASTNPVPNSVVYSATKGALDSVTAVLAKELGPRGIRVNSLNPGFTDTEGVRQGDFLNGDFEKELVGKTALGRVGQPDDIARVAVFLASPDSSWLTGETIRASGGLS